MLTKRPAVTVTSPFVAESARVAAMVTAPEPRTRMSPAALAARPPVKVTSPPKTEIGPATLRLAATVKAAVLPDLPKVKLLAVFGIENFSVLTAEAKLAPLDSMVMAPDPRRLTLFVSTQKTSPRMVVEPVCEA